MPLEMPFTTSRPADQTYEAIFPARTKQAAGMVNGIPTEVMSVSFADKIVVTISQDGRLAHWVHVPLDTQENDPRNMYTRADDQDEDTDLLPMTHLTATTVLGGTDSERDVNGQLYATQIASSIATKNPDERRMVVVGMGLREVNTSRESYLDMLELILQCI